MNLYERVKFILRSCYFIFLSATSASRVSSEMRKSFFCRKFPIFSHSGRRKRNAKFLLFCVNLFQEKNAKFLRIFFCQICWVFPRKFRTFCLLINLAFFVKQINVKFRKKNYRIILFKKQNTACFLLTFAKFTFAKKIAI